MSTMNTFILFSINIYCLTTIVTIQHMNINSRRRRCKKATTCTSNSLCHRCQLNNNWGEKQSLSEAAFRWRNHRRSRVILAEGHWRLKFKYKATTPPGDVTIATLQPKLRLPSATPKYENAGHNVASQSRIITTPHMHWCRQIAHTTNTIQFNVKGGQRKNSSQPHKMGKNPIPKPGINPQTQHPSAMGEIPYLLLSVKVSHRLTQV